MIPLPRLLYYVYRSLTYDFKVKLSSETLSPFDFIRGHRKNIRTWRSLMNPVKIK